MKNIHILPTNQLTSVLYGKDDKYKLANSTMGMDWYISSAGYKPQHIYITSNEEIREGDWFLSDFNSFPLHNIKELSERKDSLGWKQEDLKNNLKIILTTDSTLIEDGVQSIDDEFLNWFVKNPSCEFVEVNFSVKWHPSVFGGDELIVKYNIIIPQEEPKQESHICKYCNAETTQPDDECYAKPKQETLEELKSFSDFSDKFFGTNEKEEPKQTEIRYSEQEVLDLLYKRDLYLLNRDETKELELPTEWFEQNKKK
jgi:hypothetical protein